MLSNRAHHSFQIFDTSCLARQTHTIIPPFHHGFFDSDQTPLAPRSDLTHMLSSIPNISTPKTYMPSPGLITQMTLPTTPQNFIDLSRIPVEAARPTAIDDCRYHLRPLKSTDGAAEMVVEGSSTHGG
jgi:hypothetical protein